MTLFLGILCVILAGLLAVSVMFNIRHAKIILEVEDALGIALDVCDGAYRRISDVLEIPVALNTPEVRQVVAQIQDARDSVLYVSNVLAAPYGGVHEEEEESDGGAS